MATQNLSRSDDDYFSMRLYQDLLGRDHLKIPQMDAPDAAVERVPGITRIASFGSTRSDPHLSCIPQDASEWTFAKWGCAARVLCGGRCGYSGANMNSEVILFKMDPHEFLLHAPAQVRQMSATAFASSTADGYTSDAILHNDGGGVWLSAKQGADAEGQFVGIDFGIDVAGNVDGLQFHACAWNCAKRRLRRYGLSLAQRGNRQEEPDSGR